MRQCCDRHDDGFSVLSLLRTIPSILPPIPETDKKPWPRYRPVSERNRLEELLRLWLQSFRNQNDLYGLWPTRFILKNEYYIINLARQQVSKITSPVDVTRCLNETNDWHSHFSEPTFTVVSTYNINLASPPSAQPSMVNAELNSTVQSESTSSESTVS